MKRFILELKNKMATGPVKYVTTYLYANLTQKNMFRGTLMDFPMLVRHVARFLQRGTLFASIVICVNLKEGFDIVLIVRISFVLYL